MLLPSPPPPLPPEYAAQAQRLINDISVGLRSAIWDQIKAAKNEQPAPSIEQLLLQALSAQGQHLHSSAEAALQAGPNALLLQNLDLARPSTN